MGDVRHVRHVLRVASYNLRDLHDDLDAAARVVRAIDPDVLCLQEVPRHPFSGHRVAELASRCGLLWPGGHRRGGGTTLLAHLRVDVSGSRHVGLDVPPLQRGRGYAVARVALPGHRPLLVTSIHLGLDAAERQRHVATILQDLSADGPMVVAGDLNETCDGAAWRAIEQRLPTVSGDAPTFPARHPRHRIDAVFASRGIAAVVERPQPELGQPDLVAATDHLPVWVDLDVSSLGRA